MVIVGVSVIHSRIALDIRSSIGTSILISLVVGNQIVMKLTKIVTSTPIVTCIGVHKKISV